MNIKVNDNVLVITGKDKNKTGKVISSSPKTGKVIVEGVNIQKKHQKARSATDVAGIIDVAGPIDASNVMVICDKCNKATRVAHAIVDGKKVRVCKHCNASLDKAFKKETKKTTAEPKKKATRKRTAKTELAVTEEDAKLTITPEAETTEANS